MEAGEGEHSEEGAACAEPVVGGEAGVDKELKTQVAGECSGERRSERRRTAGPRRACGCVEDVGLYPKSRGKLLKDERRVGLEGGHWWLGERERRLLQ